MTPPAWAALIALAAAVFSGVQAMIALRKLRLDLFAKRYETWEAFNDAAWDRRCAYAAMTPENPRPEGGDETLLRFARLKRQMVLLFPPDVAVEVEALDAALIEFAGRAASRGTSRPGTPEGGHEAVANAQAFFDAGMRIEHLREVIMERARPHLRQYGWLETFGTPLARLAEDRARRLVDSMRGRKR